MHFRFLGVNHLLSVAIFAPVGWLKSSSASSSTVQDSKPYAAQRIGTAPDNCPLHFAKGITV